MMPNGIRNIADIDDIHNLIKWEGHHNVLKEVKISKSAIWPPYN